ncbi:MAG: tryptophan 2,3-dioxygenase [Saprospiraceae bacterium]|nr:tryptophan 2,3-dioxygenase [Saprospiraceae bacterium]
MELSADMLRRLEDLKSKYASMGQNMESYLDGLLYADYLTYWEYAHLDTLLSLQTPKTSIPDEEIFILYHQITELYFKLTTKAIKQLIFDENPSFDMTLRQIKRANTYFEHLVSSFEIMVDGMDKQEFLQFRMSLLPASGFQSGQYREIEFLSTDVYQLLHKSKRQNFSEESPLEEMYPALYWKSGATELATGKKTLTLRQFEAKYKGPFLRLIKMVKDKNLRQLSLRKVEWLKESEELTWLFKQYDLNANVRWPLAHYKSAVRYLDQKPTTIKATGGTNWQKYLPPKNQGLIFFPELWTTEEREGWGTFGMKLETNY